MKARMQRTRPTTLISFFCLVLAGLGFDARPALAQASEACPLPADVISPGYLNPSVTAQDVEDGSATLAAFAAGAREEFKSLPGQGLQQAYHFGCVIRQDGGPWRAGSTYLVQLTPGGRVLIHSKEMALSGRLLDRRILLAILRALAPSTDLSNPAAVLQRLRTEPDGMFDATDPIPVRPGIPGASGYASTYVGFRGDPIILLSGFDLTASHVIDENVDPGTPAVTAEDVVDRETLRAFVINAGTHLIELWRTSGRTAISQAKATLRDPGGPWRHGSVYLYILDTTSDTILFHGAFPDRFELRPLVATLRDAVTGEFILPQVLAAAKSNPEGDFVQYYFDDPADDTDSADIPKVGYAREFELQGTGGAISSSIIVGSGFYLDASNVVSARQGLAIKSIQPQVMRAMTDSTVDAVSSRVEQAVSGAPSAAEFRFGGVSTLSDALLANGRALENGTFDLGRLLAGTSFTLPLNAADTGTSGLFRNPTIWGGGDYRDFSGGDRQTLRYEGDVKSLNYGIDSWLGANMLAGVSVVQSRADVDYDDVNGVTGGTTTTLTGVSPYAGWRVDDRIDMWATAGYGWGDIEVDDDAGTQESDLTQQMAAAGISGLLMTRDQWIMGGTTTLRVKGEVAYTWADTDRAGALEGLTLEANRKRLLLEGTHVRTLDPGATFTSSLEFGLRHDGGDGEDGEGFETGGGLRYADPASGLTAEGRARALLGHSGDYDEWGFSALVHLDPGADGVGLAVSVEPQWGQTASGIRQMWKADAISRGSQEGRSPLQVNARVAYGLVAPWGWRQGVLAPYTDMSLSGEGLRRVSLGGQFSIGSAAWMSLEAMHDQPAYGSSDQGIMLRGDLNW